MKCTVWTPSKTGYQASVGLVTMATVGLVTMATVSLALLTRKAGRTTSVLTPIKLILTTPDILLPTPLIRTETSGNRSLRQRSHSTPWDHGTVITILTCLLLLLLHTRPTIIRTIIPGNLLRSKCAG